MELKIKDKNKIKREEGPTWNQTWGILKYLSAEFFTETSEIDQVKLCMNVGQTTCVSDILGQKLGYDRCPYLSFFVRRFEDGIFDLTSRRDLNTSTPFLT